MTPGDFVKTTEWKHTREEMRLEIGAVFLPVLIYGVGLATAEFGLSHFLTGVADATLAHFLVVPDALFGACILFAFAAIQGFRFREDESGASVVASETLHRWKYAAVAGLFAAAVLAGIAVIFHPAWAMVVGLLAMYFAALTYKKILFLRTYVARCARSA